MTATVKMETRRGPFVAVYPDGRRVAMEREVITVDDWRDTVIGPMNFGRVTLIPWRHVDIS